jgi:hypothetical protein
MDNKSLNTEEGKEQAKQALADANSWIADQKAKGNKRVDYAYLSYSSPDYTWIIMIMEKHI